MFNFLEGPAEQQRHIEHALVIQQSKETLVNRVALVTVSVVSYEI